MNEEGFKEGKRQAPRRDVGEGCLINLVSWPVGARYWSLVWQYLGSSREADSCINKLARYVDPRTNCSDECARVHSSVGKVTKEELAIVILVCSPMGDRVPQAAGHDPPTSTSGTLQRHMSKN